MVQLQSFSAGVGNWVADEILHQARIHPEQKANSLVEDQVAALHHQMQVLDTASFACSVTVKEALSSYIWTATY